MRWLAVASMTLACAACGDGDGDDKDTGSDVADSATDTQVDDTTGDTTATDTTTDATAPVEVTPTKGFGEPCSTNLECLSAFCVPTAVGNACTRPCGQQCPEGWSCGRVLSAGVDGVEVCLDRQTTLCHPCTVDADCNLFGGSSDNACVDYGEAGSFCGIPCGAELPCPTGYACSDDDGAPTTGEGQCRPAEGAECTCNPLAVTLARKTSCSVSNELGTCVGERGCEGEALAACGAAPAVTETCNNVDDDCNGVTDDDIVVGGDCLVVNTFGSCPGRAFCVGGEEECVGLPAQAEVCDNQDQDCDGLTDEGFPNFDGDEQPDCLDDDDDDDGVVDGEDCAPKDATRHQGATETCNDEDDDCNGQKDDEGAEGCTVYYQDVDRDTYGSLAAPARCLCAPDATTFYDRLAQSDCNDLDGSVFPGATEVCNTRDDSCEGDTDEGVQAPCGGCRNACLLEVGDGGASAFAAGQAVDLVVTGGGHLELASGKTSGTYRQVWSGWPLDDTEWRILFVDVAYPPGANGGGTAITLRWRTADTAEALATATFSTVAGPFPPAYLPVWPEVTGALIEVELAVTSSAAGTTPTIRSISVFGAVAE